MKSISIHGLGHVPDAIMKEKARKQGISANKTVKGLLEEAVDIKPKDREVGKQEYADLFGVWDATDLREFNEANDALDRADAKDWK